MQQDPHNPWESEQEFSLGDLFLLIGAYLKELKKSWFLLCALALALGAYQLYKTYITKATYTASLTFMRAGAGNYGGMNSILGQFGGLLGSSEGENQEEKIMELARSRKIIGETLFSICNLGGDSDYLANHIIRIKNLHQEWAEDTTLHDFLFKQKDISRFTRAENKALLALYGVVLSGSKHSGAIFNINASSKTGILTMNGTTEDEGISICFLDSLYHNLSLFYENNAMKQQRENYALLEQKRDSLARALNQNDYAAANFNDRSSALLFESTKVPKVKYQRNNQILTAAYAEAVKNLELAKYSLESTQPFLTSIDLPIAPIKPAKPSKIKAIAIGLTLGLILGSVFVIFRKIIRDALNRVSTKRAVL